MPKKERIFPIDTVGGRIQHKRHELGISRSKLYDLVYNIAEKSSDAGSESSKEKTVFHWESNKTQLDYNTLKAMCKTLQCSSDYLLGLDECSNKTYQFIHDETGLSEKAIEELHHATTYPKGREDLTVIDYLLCRNYFNLHLIREIEKYYNAYMHYKNGLKLLEQQEKEMDSLANGDIIKEFELLENKEFQPIIRYKTLEEFRNSKDAKITHIKTKFGEIIENFAEYRYKEGT